MTQYLAIDVGGTSIKYAVMDEEAQISDKGEYPTPKEDGLNGFLKVIHNIYATFGKDVKAVVMSAPGRIDANTGYFYTSGALGYIDRINLADRVKEFIPVPFMVENDAKAAALAELWKGSMQGVQNGIVMTLGTGIGGAIIIDGKLYRGSTFAAGEFSGIPTSLFTTPYDSKGMWAIPNSVNALVHNYAQASSMDVKKCNGRVLFDAANKGDTNALTAIDDFCKTLAAGIMSLQFALDVQKVAVGGGISKQPILMESLKKQLHIYYDDNLAAVLPASIPEVTACTFGNDANMIGALYHYLHH